jgi:SAM-dependent methyltransferase
MDRERIKSFAEKIYADMAGSMAVGMAYVGVITGLFRAMDGKGPLRMEDVVQATGLQQRYVQEWLSGMAAAGYLDYEPERGTFELASEHGYLLASDGTDHFVGGLFHFAPVLLGMAPKVAEAFRTGGGVPFKDFGPECVVALDMINRGQYEHRFGTHWLKQLPGISEQLEDSGRVLDFGCGVGRVAITIAKDFPKSEVLGRDLDPESIRQARAAAIDAGVQTRVRCAVTAADQVERGDGFDLITACDCVHDFAKPVETLKSLGALLKPDGTLFVVEPRAADRLEENMNPIATMYYGFSIFHCMTQSLAEGGPGLGTCMGPTRMRTLLYEAGFSRFEQVPIRSQTNLFYAARL